MTSRIAVVGAGPGGLTLACLLDRQGISCSVFEREPDPLARPQGGTLDLHRDSGQRALAAAGLMDAFRSVARYEDQGDRMLAADGRVLFEDDGQGAGDRPEVDRTELRKLLLDALPASSVRWGHSLREARPVDGARWELVFEDGRVAGPFDLVVGADGAWSRLRPLISRYVPQYSGLSFVEFGIDDVDRSHPNIAALVGRGKVGIEGDGRAIIAQRNGHAHVRGYAIFRVPRDWAQRRFDLESPDAVRAGLLQEFAGFAEEVRALFRVCNDSFVVRPICALPVGHHWQHRAGLTLLGDAAHLMSPFGGEGVNAAMLDALELADALGQSTDASRAAAEYERGMFERVREAAEQSADAAATFLSHEGAEAKVREYLQHRGMHLSH